MMPESQTYLALAREDLTEAKVILEIGLAKVAVRSAYFAAFHAAEAAILSSLAKS